jgi:hypothetical protein
MVVVSEELLSVCLLVREGQLWQLDCVFHGFHESLFPICLLVCQEKGPPLKKNQTQQMCVFGSS